MVTPANFTLSTSRTYTLMQFKQINGRFRNVTVPAGWRLSYGETSITIRYEGIQSVPEPGTLVSCGLGALALFGRKRLKTSTPNTP